MPKFSICLCKSSFSGETEWDWKYRDSGNKEDNERKKKPVYRPENRTQKRFGPPDIHNSEADSRINRQNASRCQTCVRLAIFLDEWRQRRKEKNEWKRKKYKKRVVMRRRRDKLSHANQLRSGWWSRNGVIFLLKGWNGAKPAFTFCFSSRGEIGFGMGSICEARVGFTSFWWSLYQLRHNYTSSCLSAHWRKLRFSRSDIF